MGSGVKTELKIDSKPKKRAEDELRGIGAALGISAEAIDRSLNPPTPITVSNDLRKRFWNPKDIMRVNITSNKEDQVDFDFWFAQQVQFPSWQKPVMKLFASRFTVQDGTPVTSASPAEWQILFEKF